MTPGTPVHVGTAAGLYSGELFNLLPRRAAVLVNGLLVFCRPDQVYTTRLGAWFRHLMESPP